MTTKEYKKMQRQYKRGSKELLDLLAKPGNNRKVMTDKERNERLKKLLDKEFLEKLSEAARLYGWSVDYYEVDAFVCGLWETAGVKRPYTEPYEINYE